MRLKIIILVVVLLLFNGLAWVVSESFFVDDARQLDIERSNRQAFRISRMLERESLSLSRIILGRKDQYVLVEVGVNNRDGVGFQHFVTADFLVGANIDSLVIANGQGDEFYVGPSGPTASFLDMPVETKDRLKRMMNEPGKESFSGLMLLKNGSVAVVAGQSVPFEPNRGWVVASRFIDAEQLQVYRDLLDSEFSIVASSGPNPPAETESVRIDIGSKKVHWSVTDLFGEKTIRLSMPYVQNYEEHMLATMNFSRMIILLLSILVGGGSLLLLRQREIGRQQQDRARREIERFSRLAAVGELAAGVAHEINNPNGVIQRNLDFIQDVLCDALPLLSEREDTEEIILGGVDFSTVKAELPQLLEDMTIGSRRIAEIVRDLKDFSQEDVSQDNEPFDLNEIVSISIRMLDGAIRRSTDHFSFAADERLLTVNGVRRQIEQVVINLIQNACQALGSRNQKIVVTSQNAPDMNFVILTVEDQGRGVLPENIERIFEPFFTTRRQEGGTGLGLSVSLGIVRRHGGNLRAEPNPGGGTRMILTLPAVKE